MAAHLKWLDATLEKAKLANVRIRQLKSNAKGLILPKTAVAEYGVDSGNIYDALDKVYFVTAISDDGVAVVPMGGKRATTFKLEDVHTENVRELGFRWSMLLGDLERCIHLAKG